MRNRIAVPMIDGVVSGHFGHSEQFVIVTIVNGEITKEELLSPPEHTHGSYPKFLAGHNVDVVIVGGIGSHAVEILQQNGIQVISGAPESDLKSIIEAYTSGKLLSSNESCNHHDHNHDHNHQHKY
jgi:ATP-binding protein involved in chromosome partitioning